MSADLTKLVDEIRQASGAIERGDSTLSRRIDQIASNIDDLYRKVRSFLQASPNRKKRYKTMASISEGCRTMSKFTVIEGGGPPKGDDPQIRPLTPADASAALTCFWLASQLVRRTLAGWAVDGKRPSKNQLLYLAHDLMVTESWVEDLAKGPETDGHSLDGPIRGLQLQVAELDKRQDANSERE